MFLNIWDEKNTAIKINKFNEDLLANQENPYQNALYDINKKYGVKTDNYKMVFKSKDKDGFNQTMHFSLLYDCFCFLISDTFCYLYESEDIDFIKITASKEVIFKFDYKYEFK